MTNIIPLVVFQHSQDAADLHAIRTRLVKSASSRLNHLQRFDDRLAAHIDGLIVAGPASIPFCDGALATPTPGALFTAAVLAISTQSADHLARLLALAQAAPETQSGLVSAFGWVEQAQLRGTVVALLNSKSHFERLLGLKACAMHRVMPNKLRDMMLEPQPLVLRARAFRMAGEFGQQDLLPVCLRALSDPDDGVRFWAAWSATLLGNRQVAAEYLMQLDQVPEPLQPRAVQLALLASSQPNAHAWLQQLASRPQCLRWLIQGCGLAGEPSYVTWLIKHMSDPETARLAGEAFSLITGLDLASLQWVRPPEDLDSEPTDDPNDPSVELDADDGLPWPDEKQIGTWWQSNGARFTPGTRYFLGHAVTEEHCLRVLAEGTQRQRMLAAQYLCLLKPGMPLFECRAPAFRQRRHLAALV